MWTRFFSLLPVLLAVSAFTLAADTYFEVIDNEENSLFGTILSLDRTQVVVDVQGTPQTIPTDKLIKIRNLAPNPYMETSATPGPQNVVPPIPSLAMGGRNLNDRRLADDILRRLQANAPSIRKTFPANVIVLELNDGSRLIASSFTVANDQGICRLLEQQNDLSIPLNTISAVRFTVRSLSDAINPPADWLPLAVPNTEGDRLVVGNPGAFDVYSGILGDVSAETISFTVDGDVLPVPRRRVYGLVLHSTATPATPLPVTPGPPLGILTLWTGTRAMISDFRIDANELTWTTTTDITVTVPLEMVSELDFGEAGITYLIDLDRTRNEFSFPFASEIRPEQWRLLQTFFESRTKGPREVILDGTMYDRGMTLLGTTSLEYRLPKPFATFRGVVGIEDQYRPHAAARLQIFADSQILGTWEVRGDTASQRIDVNLPQNTRLLTMTTEPLPQSGASTILTIVDAKLAE